VEIKRNFYHKEGKTMGFFDSFGSSKGSSTWEKQLMKMDKKLPPVPKGGFSERQFVENAQKVRDNLNSGNGK
jgi:hypothetical protein